MAKYKYECRPCPPHIRAQCIQEAGLSPASKRIIAQAFLSKTDTQDTWDFLQRNCLLVRREGLPHVAPAIQKGGLWDRIHKKEETPSQKETASQEGSIAVVKPRASRPENRQSGVTQKTTFSESTTYPSSTERSRSPRQTTLTDPPSATRVLPSKKETKPRILRYPRAIAPSPETTNVPGPRILVSRVIGHRISLPTTGELVLGRFDPHTQSKPDIDLSFEDRITRGISRRHCKLTSWRGRYAIEDLGSSYGTWINDEKLALEQKHVLNVGDLVRLGNCVLYFDRPPSLWQAPFALHQCFFYSTFTGQYFGLTQKTSFVIGRADPSLNFMPDIDLGDDEAALSSVSRRHARLIWREDQFTVEDLGSIQKTRLEGQPVPIGTRVPLSPGQHLWLGGYTIAFDLVESS